MKAVQADSCLARVIWMEKSNKQVSIEMSKCGYIIQPIDEFNLKESLILLYYLRS